MTSGAPTGAEHTPWVGEPWRQHPRNKSLLVGNYGPVGTPMSHFASFSSTEGAWAVDGEACAARAAACVSACAGLADPEREVGRLRDAEEDQYAICDALRERARAAGNPDHWDACPSEMMGLLIDQRDEAVGDVARLREERDELLEADKASGAISRAFVQVLKELRAEAAERIDALQARNARLESALREACYFVNGPGSAMPRIPFEGVTWEGLMDGWRAALDAAKEEADAS